MDESGSLFKVPTQAPCVVSDKGLLLGSRRLTHWMRALAASARVKNQRL